MPESVAATAIDEADNWEFFGSPAPRHVENHQFADGFERARFRDAS